MHRRDLLEIIDRYRRDYPEEAARSEALSELVRSRADCFERACLPAHLTASVWIVSQDRERFLLTRHRKLGRWLQLGGHADGDPDLRRVALREAREESGMAAFSWLLRGGEVRAVDLDIHPIPARPPEPAHEHHDVRFVLVAHPDQVLRRSAESLDLRWFERSELEQRVEDASLLRLGRKAYAWFDAASNRPPELRAAC